MKFYSIDGKLRNLKNPRKYHIDWEASSRSKFQKGVKDFLYPYWSSDVVFEEFRIVGSRLSLDFYNANKKIAALLIEIALLLIEIASLFIEIASLFRAVKITKNLQK